MKRSALREQVFSLLFRLPFYNEEEMAEQEALFLAPVETPEWTEDEFPDPFSDDETLPPLTESGAKKVRERFDSVLARIPEIDALLQEKTEG